MAPKMVRRRAWMPRAWGSVTGISASAMAWDFTWANTEGSKRGRWTTSESSARAGPVSKGITVTP